LTAEIAEYAEEDQAEILRELGVLWVKQFG
jgi:hypothetical protein